MITAEDRLAILDLCARYSWNADHGDVEAWIDTFAVDGVLSAMGNDVVGHDGLRAWTAARGDGSSTPGSVTRHWTNAHTIWTDGHAVRHRCYWLGVVGDAEGIRVGATGSYDDVLVKGDDGGWWFARREIGWELPAL